MKHFIPIALIFLMACSTASQTGSSRREDPNPRPAWMSAKPNNPAYFAGIGYASKLAANNYMQVAKKNALEDLVSEIKINVSATSVLTQIDRGKEFSDQYESIIQTSVADEIEEYELVGAWEDKEAYWVYYRLSKARYNEIKDQQRRNAVALSLDFFGRAKQAERTGDAIGALSFYFKAFNSLEKYLAEAIRANFEGTDVLLINDIYGSIQAILSNINVRSSINEIEINRRVNLGLALPVEVSYLGKPLAGLPLFARFEKGAGELLNEYKTDEAGKTQILVSRIDARDAQQSVVVRPNIIALAGNEPSPLFELITSRLSLPFTQVLLNVKRPLVYISADERSFGEPRNNGQVSTRVKSVLTEAGFEFTNNKDLAELWVKVNADSERGSITGSIYVSFVSVVIKVEDIKAGRDIYATSIDRVRGFSLDYERSSQDGYNKVLETLEKETMPALINAVLQ